MGAKLLEWDEPVPERIKLAWKRWNKELPLLKEFCVARPYFPKDIDINDVQLHGFCNTSEVEYSGVVYLRPMDDRNNIHVALVMAKTKVAPIKRLSIPRLELCGAVIVSKLIHHVAKILEVALSNIFAWTDSRVTMGWLRGNPQRFLTFVGNRVLQKYLKQSQWPAGVT